MRKSRTALTAPVEMSILTMSRHFPGGGGGGGLCAGLYSEPILSQNR